MHYVKEEQRGNISLKIQQDKIEKIFQLASKLIELHICSKRDPESISGYNDSIDDQPYITRIAMKDISFDFSQSVEKQSITESIEHKQILCLDNSFLRITQNHSVSSHQCLEAKGNNNCSNSEQPFQISMSCIIDYSTRKEESNPNQRAKPKDSNKQVEEDEFERQAIDKRAISPAITILKRRKPLRTKNPFYKEKNEPKNSNSYCNRGSPFSRGRLIRSNSQNMRFHAQNNQKFQRYHQYKQTYIQDDQQYGRYDNQDHPYSIKNYQLKEQYQTDPKSREKEISTHTPMQTTQNTFPLNACPNPIGDYQNAWYTRQIQSQAQLNWNNAHLNWWYNMLAIRSEMKYRDLLYCSRNQYIYPSYPANADIPLNPDNTNLRYPCNIDPHINSADFFSMDNYLPIYNQTFPYKEYHQSVYSNVCDQNIPPVSTNSQWLHPTANILAHHNKQDIYQGINISDNKNPNNKLEKEEQLKLNCIQTIGKIYLPKFQIMVNGSCLSVNCCKMSRLTAEAILVPYSSLDFDLYPMRKEDQRAARDQCEKLQQRLKDKKSNNGDVTLICTPQSEYKMIAFMKVPKTKDQNFNFSFNRGLSNLLLSSQLQSERLTLKSLIIPYTFEFGSSREKINKLIELLKMEKKHKFKRIIINCENVKSFRRMTDGLSKVIGALDQKGQLAF